MTGIAGKHAETEATKTERALAEILEALRAREDDRFLDQRGVCAMTTLHRNTIYKLEMEGRFPERRILCGGKIVWLASEVLRWVRSRPTSEQYRSGGEDSDVTMGGVGREQEGRDAFVDVGKSGRRHR